MLNTIIIGNKISEARKKRSISQAELARQLSITSQAVGKWERGESMPDIITLNLLAEILEVDLNYFSEIFKSSSFKNIDGESSAEEKADVAPDISSQKTGWDMSWNMSGGNWTDADFSGLKNIGEKFSNSNIQNCLFTGSDLSGLLLKGNNVEKSNFSGSALGNSCIKNSNISRSFFRDCSFREGCISGSNISACDFTGADFTGMIVKSSVFAKNIVTGATWNNTAFRNTQISDITFEGLLENCSFENCGFIRFKFENATLVNTFFKNRSLKKIRFVECKADNLTFAFLKSGKADLTGITLLEQQ